MIQKKEQQAKRKISNDINTKINKQKEKLRKQQRWSITITGCGMIVVSHLWPGKVTGKGTQPFCPQRKLIYCKSPLTHTHTHSHKFARVHTPQHHVF